MTSTQELDQRLLRRLRSGDRDAFEALFRRYYAEMLRFATSRLGSRDEAEDVVHDVFLRVWEERERLGGDRAMRTYLLVAVRNRATDKLRQRGVRARWIESTVPVERDHDLPAHLPEAVDPAAAHDPAALIELQCAIRRATAALPERCRLAFLLCREQGLTYAEAAEVMNVTPATVKTQVARALASLRVSLSPFLSVVLAVSSLCR